VAPAPLALSLSLLPPRVPLPCRVLSCLRAVLCGARCCACGVVSEGVCPPDYLPFHLSGRTCPAWCSSPTGDLRGATLALPPSCLLSVALHKQLCCSQATSLLLLLAHGYSQRDLCSTLVVAPFLLGVHCVGWASPTSVGLVCLLGVHAVHPSSLSLSRACASSALLCSGACAPRLVVGCVCVLALSIASACTCAPGGLSESKRDQA